MNKILKITGVLTILIYLTSNTCYAQKTALIAARWKYKDIANKETMDSAILNSAKAMMAKMEIEFAADGKYYFGESEMGTWSLNKEENKVTVAVPDKTIGGRTMPGKTMEMAVKSVTEKELVINMGQITLIMQKAPPRPVAPAKTKTLNEKVLAECGTTSPEDALIKMVSAVRSKNIDQVMNTACTFGVKSFNLSQDPDDKESRNLNSGQVEECIQYISNEKVMNDSYGLRIEQFKNGDLKAVCVLSPEVQKALYQKCSSGALTLLKREGPFDYFGAGTKELSGVMVFPNGTREGSDYNEWFIGGMCTIYNFSEKK